MTQDDKNPDQHRTAIDRAKFDVHPDVDAAFAVRTLSPRKRRMVNAYVREGTYAAAAKASGYNAQTVKRLVMHDPDVRKVIGELVQQAATLSGVTLERVLEEYARLAFFDPKALIDVLRSTSDPELALEEFAALPSEVTAAVSELTVEMTPGKAEGDPPTGRVKLKTYDKKSVLQDLGRMLSVFDDKLTITDRSAFGDRLQRAVEKIEGMNAGEGGE